MDVQGSPKSGVGLFHYPLQEIQGLSQTPGEGELERGRRGLTIPGLGEVGSQETLDYDGVDLSIGGMRQAVATFNFGQEAPGHEEALLFKGDRKHHIVPLGNRRRG
jgi:hypothetical protein